MFFGIELEDSREKIDVPLYSYTTNNNKKSFFNGFVEKIWIHNTCNSMVRQIRLPNATTIRISSFSDIPIYTQCTCHRLRQIPSKLFKIVRIYTQFTCHGLRTFVQAFSKCESHYKSILYR